MLRWHQNHHDGVLEQSLNGSTVPSLVKGCRTTGILGTRFSAKTISRLSKSVMLTKSIQNEIQSLPYSGLSDIPVNLSNLRLG